MKRPSRRTSLTTSRWAGASVAEAGVSYDGVRGLADNAAQGVSWNTLLGNASFWWAATKSSKTWIFAGYRRAADSLPLDMLAYGDPAAPAGTVSAWTAQGVGPVVARVGPGTGGNPAFSAIDASLGRPTTDEFTVGAESRPMPGMRVRLAGVIKRQQSRIDLVNTGVPLSSYSLSTIVDGRPAADGGSVLLPVYNRLPSSFGRDQYLLTNNASEEAATFSGVVLSGDIATGPWTFLFGATASQTDGLGANRGFHVDENDPGLAGEVFTDPNANTDARGRLFFDRAFTIKLASVYRFAHGVNIGLVARYQDGQPFSRVTVVPGLNQGTDFVRAYPGGRRALQLHRHVRSAAAEGLLGRAHADRRHPRLVQPLQPRLRSRRTRRDGPDVPLHHRHPATVGRTCRSARHLLTRIWSSGHLVIWSSLIN